MMGMAKIKRGSGFKGALSYALDKGQLIGGNMAGEDVAALSSEFKLFRQLRPDIQKPVWHESLRLPEGERIKPEQWNLIADDFMNQLGFDETYPRVYVLHDEPEGQHIHIIASRISLSSELYLGQNENLKATHIIRALEQKYQLSHYATAKSEQKIQRQQVSTNEKGLWERTGEAPLKRQLQSVIDLAVADQPNFAQWVERLNKAGVSIVPSGKTGTPQGISFEFKQHTFKGSDLGKSYAWKGLQQRIHYDKERDQPHIDRLRGVFDAQNQTSNYIEVSAVAKPPVASKKTAKPKTRTLDNVFYKDQNHYKWKGSGTTAFIDNDSSIQVFSKNPTSIKAALQLAQNKQWQVITVHGTADFRRSVWLMGQQMGFTIQGYEPTPADLITLNGMLNEPRENSHNADADGQPGAGTTHRYRTDGDGAENRHQHGSHQPEESGIRQRIDSNGTDTSSRNGSYQSSEPNSSFSSQKRNSGIGQNTTATATTSRPATSPAGHQNSGHYLADNSRFDERLLRRVDAVLSELATTSKESKRTMPKPQQSSATSPSTGSSRPQGQTQSQITQKPVVKESDVSVNVLLRPTPQQVPKKIVVEVEEIKPLPKPPTTPISTVHIQTKPVIEEGAAVNEPVVTAPQPTEKETGRSEVDTQNTLEVEPESDCQSDEEDDDFRPSF